MVNLLRTVTLSVLLLFLIPGGKKAMHTTAYRFPEMLFFPQMPQNPDNPVTIEGVALGRYLFYDPILSRDSSISCSTCHRQEAAFSDSPKQFSQGDGPQVLTRNTPPLFNLAWYPAMFWDGRAANIEDQVFFSVRSSSEMNLQWPEAGRRIRRSPFYREKFNKAFGKLPIDSILISRAIGQFERTLLSYNSKYDQVIRGEAYFNEDEVRGFELMNDQVKGDCMHCHTTDGNALGTTRTFSNNGLDDAGKASEYKDLGLGGITKNPGDIGKFKIPSLRNIALTAPYMHDGRFQSLEQVLDFYSEGVHASLNVDSKMASARKSGLHLSSIEKEQIIAFLRTLSDSTLLSNEAFGNPF